MLELPYVRATFWKLKGRKSVRHCGGKHVLSQKVQITTCSGHFWTTRFPFHVEKCTPLWREAHLEVKSVNH